jgi:hypothetical protein
MPAASYFGCKASGDLLIISGQLPLKNGKPMLTGKLGDGVAYIAARQLCIEHPWTGKSRCRRRLE